ncbi:MAG: hypothetical protein HYZ20_13975 [Burkholderiales bacterium]|nr:hypothetical protein [Burkholderiales bacterium]
MEMKVWPGLLALGLMAQAPMAALAGSSPWVPIVDGATWAFLESGQYENSEGVANEWGPELAIARFDAVDEQIFDHHANFKLTKSGDVDFFQLNEDGLFRVSDGDPRDASSGYRYYVDPRPFLLTAPLEIGEERVYAGDVFGQEVSPFFGTYAWAGSWSAKYTNLGPEEVTVPLGTFQATRFRLDSERVSFAGSSSSRDYWTEIWWVVEGALVAKVMGEGGGTSDYNGDGLIDRWYLEQLTMVATTVPEVGTAYLSLAGLLSIGAVVWLRRRSHRAVPDDSGRPS